MKLIVLAVLLVALAVVMVVGGPATDQGQADRIKNGDEPPPAWTGWIDLVTGSFAPRVESFTDGTTSVSVAAGTSLEKRLHSGERDVRIARFEITGGQLARLTYVCERSPAGACPSNGAVTLCLARAGVPKPAGCQPGAMRADGALQIGAGGGRLSVAAEGTAASVRFGN